MACWLKVGVGPHIHVQGRQDLIAGSQAGQAHLHLPRRSLPNPPRPSTPCPAGPSCAVLYEHTFRNEYLYYRFVEDDVQARGGNGWHAVVVRTLQVPGECTAAPPKDAPGWMGGGRRGETRHHTRCAMV